MTDEQYQGIISALEDVKALLHNLVVIATEPQGCPHLHTEDHGTMGMPAGAKVYCTDCQRYIAGGE